LHPIVATGPHGVLVLSLPSVVPDPVEPGPPVAATFFVMDSWTGSTSGTFFTGIGLGKIFDGTGHTVLSDGRFEFSSPDVQIGQPTSFSATLIASTIPVPGAMWIFGSGLLLMTAVMRRRVK
jgi:hypothetical protein